MGNAYIGMEPQNPFYQEVRTKYIASAGQTLFTGLAYKPGYIDVYVNGSKLVDGTDFLALNGNSVTMSVSLTAGDIVEIQTRVPTNIADVLNHETGVPRAELASNAGAGLVGYQSEGGVARDVAGKLGEFVSVLDFIPESEHVAIRAGNSTYDCTSAAQAATNTGKPVMFPAGIYRITGVAYVGKVTWFSDGGSKIISDSAVITVTFGSGSSIDNLELENITAPWIINRNPSNWLGAVMPVQSNGDGYQPTVNDEDIWSSLTTDQRNQDIGPKIIFQGNASDIVVSRIKGRFVSILVYDAVRSVVRDCNFRAGKSFGGGVLFWNINGQAGSHNKAINNHIRFPSYNGIAFARNFDGLAEGNHVEYSGESGIKTWQNTVGGVDARCYRMQIQGNNTKFCYYDGFDLSSDFPHTGNVDSRHQIIGNNSFNNRRTGYYGDGQNNQFVSNVVRATGLSGVKLLYNNSQVSGNHAYDCNTSNAVSGEHQILIDGSDNSIIANFARQVVANGNAIYASGTNKVDSNYANGGVIYMGNPGSITATFENNVDSIGSVTTQSFVVALVNTGASLAHLFYSEGGSSALGERSGKIIGLSSAINTTPTGTDSSTAFVAGLKIGSAATNTLHFNVANQNEVRFEGLATIEFNDTGTPLIVRCVISNININGVTRKRLSVEFRNASTGAPFALTTTNITSGKAIACRFYGKLA